MKKQLLILMVLALFASTNQIFGQALPGPTQPRPISCDLNNPFAPVAGVQYTYSATVDPSGGTAYWFATTETTFKSGALLTTNQEVVGGTYVSAANDYRTDLTVPLPSPGTTSTQITWTTEGLAAATVASTDAPELFVVVNYTAASEDCADNLKVYPIRPINAFVIDVTNMTSGATPTSVPYDELTEQCADVVQSAEWVTGPTPDGQIDYDFGTQYLYFEVIAANFTGSYDPSFQIEGLQTSQTADIHWGYTVGTYDHLVTVGGANNTTYPGGTVETDETSTEEGVSIYVRVTVHNDNWETLVVNPITLRVDAINSEGQDDVNNATCEVNTAFEDHAIQNVNPRPTVTEVAPGVFIPRQP